MTQKNIIASLVIWVILVLSALVVFPLDKGTIFSRGVELGLDLQGGLRLVYEADLSGVQEGNKDEILQGVVKVITNRINPLGVSEPQIEKQGEDRIVVSLPGLSISDTEKDRIGRTALLEFREYKEVDGEKQWIPAKGVDRPQLRIPSKPDRAGWSRDHPVVALGKFCGFGFGKRRGIPLGGCSRARQRNRRHDIPHNRTSELLGYARSVFLWTVLFGIWKLIQERNGCGCSKGGCGEGDCENSLSCLMC